MRTKLVAALGVALMFCGCASVTRGTTEPVQFDSEPTGAEMRSIVDYPCGGPCPTRDQSDQNGAPYDDTIRTPTVPGVACITPCTVQVPRNQKLIVTFTKPGYQPQTVKLGSAVSAAGGAGVAGNLIVGGVTGLVVDGVTGAGYDHQPNPLKVTLVAIAPPPSAERPKRKK